MDGKAAEWGTRGRETLEAPHSSQWSRCVAAKAAAFRFLAHWAYASLHPSQAALGSGPLKHPPKGETPFGNPICSSGFPRDSKGTCPFGGCARAAPSQKLATAVCLFCYGWFLGGSASKLPPKGRRPFGTPIRSPEFHGFPKEVSPLDRLALKRVRKWFIR